MNVNLCLIFPVTIMNAVYSQCYKYISISPLSPLCCPRDVSSAGLVIANHQDIKSEIETRADSFTACIEMGNTLINNNHYAADEVLCNRSLSLYLQEKVRSKKGPYLKTYFGLLHNVSL